MKNDVMNEKEKIDALIENYKVVSEETKSYLTEMIRCFVYAAVVLAIGFGYGEHVQPIIKYMPLAFMGLFVYFFSLGVMYVSASRYKAQIESKINLLADDKLFGFELYYKPGLLRTGFLPYGKWRCFPLPNLLLGVMILGVFFYLVRESLNLWIYIGGGLFFGVVALYVFLFIPWLIEKYQMDKGWIPKPPPKMPTENKEID